jgi:D-amino peptidase
MKILIAADMEGISGVVHWDHVDPAHTEYARFRRLMTGDVNAAIRGAYDGGADQVVVADGHAHGRNILIEELDPRAVLNSGSPSPLAMVQGCDAGMSAAMFVGYHARVGSQHGILDHTWSSSTIANMWLNGQLMGETGMNAAVCGHFGVPVILVSGDQTVCAEATGLLGPIETVAVKQASGRMAAECLSPDVAQLKIFEAARLAASRIRAGQGPQPLHIQTPVTVTVDLVSSEMADRLELLQGARRLEGKRIEIVAEDMLIAYRLLRAAVVLARG